MSIVFHARTAPRVACMAGISARQQAVLCGRNPYGQQCGKKQCVRTKASVLRNGGADLAESALCGAHFGLQRRQLRRVGRAIGLHARQLVPPLRQLQLRGCMPLLRSAAAPNDVPACMQGRPISAVALCWTYAVAQSCVAKPIVMASRVFHLACAMLQPCVLLHADPAVFTALSQGLQACDMHVIQKLHAGAVQRDSARGLAHTVMERALANAQGSNLEALVAAVALAQHALELGGLLGQELACAFTVDVGCLDLQQDAICRILQVSARRHLDTYIHRRTHSQPSRLAMMLWCGRDSIWIKFTI